MSEALQLEPQSRPGPPRLATEDLPSYCPDLLDEICERIAEGEPLAQICRDSHMPSQMSVWKWAARDERTRLAIAYARDVGADAIATDALHIADDTTGDPQRDKLRIDTRLRLLAKWNPKRYGEAMQLRHADADGEKLDTKLLVSELLSLTGKAPSEAADEILDVTPKRLAPAADGQPRAFVPMAPRAPRRQDVNPILEAISDQEMNWHLKRGRRGDVLVDPKTYVPRAARHKPAPPPIDDLI